MTKGGKQPGAGRPTIPTAERASKLVSMKLTPKQYIQWGKMGASRWCKRLIDESIKKPT